MINRLSVVTGTLLLCTTSPAVLAEIPPIERLAPENSIVIVGARNTQKAMDNVKRTGLWEMWQSEKLSALRADQMKEFDEQLKQMMAELGVEEDSLVCPTGASGLAMFSVMDPDMGTPQMAVLAFADYGDEADKTHTLLRAALDKGERDGKLEFEEKDVAGRTVLTVDLSRMQPEEDADEDDFGGMPMMPMPDPEDILGGMTQLNYVREGSTLMICSDMTALTDALEVIDGGEGKLSSRDDFMNTIDQVGGSADADVYAVMLTRDVMDMMGEGGMMIGMFRPTIRALTGEVAGYAMSMRFDTDAAMVQPTIGVFMPNGKKGLTKLMDNPAPRGEVPTFVGMESASFMSMNFDFGGLMGVIKNVINSNPMLAGQAGAQIEQIEPMVAPMFNAMGSKFMTSNTGASPLMAFECKDVQGFENGFAGLAAQMGFESRDFLGQRIYTMAEGVPLGLPGMAAGEAEPVSLGLGGGFVFVGPTPSVEGALRATGNADAATLARTDMFRRAVASLGDEPVVAWGYSDYVTGFDEMARAQQEQMKSMIEEIKEFDPDMAAEMEEEAADSAKMLETINSEFLKQYIGPMVWQMRSNDKGFVVNAYLLSAN